MKKAKIRVCNSELTESPVFSLMSIFTTNRNCKPYSMNVLVDIVVCEVSIKFACNVKIVRFYGDSPAERVENF